MKKTWVAPKLIILVRGKPEESVLDTCKEGGQTVGGGPVTGELYCTQSYPSCAQCSDLSDS